MISQNIEWSDYIERGNTYVVTDEKIRNIENQLGVKFPEDYLAVVKFNAGKCPCPADVDVKNRGTSVSCLLTFETDPKDVNYVYSLDFAIKNRDDRPELIVPFADTGGASTFCFDFRNDKTNPTVVFDNSDFEFDDKRAITQVADSFTEFLEMLYEPKAASA